MVPFSGIISTILVSSSFTGYCLNRLDDSTSLVQREQQLLHASQDPDRTFLKDPAPEFHERNEFEGYVDPNEKVAPVQLAKKHKGKLHFNPFKSMINNINLAIGSVKDGLESSTREVVHQAVADMKDVGQQLHNDLHTAMHEVIQNDLKEASHAQPASLLQVAEETERLPLQASSLLELDVSSAAQHKPKLNLTASSASSKKKKSKGGFNPFKEMISGINDAISSIKDNVASSTRDLIHETTKEISDAGKEISTNLKTYQVDAGSPA